MKKQKHKNSFLNPMWGTLRRIGMILSSILIIKNVSTAQVANSLAFPSANNSFLNTAGMAGSASGVGVDLYTGAAQINIPVCNISSKDLSIPVSLNYVGGRGIKVQDYATCVGLGWQLSAGGSISRVVRGFPDECADGYLGTKQWGKKIVDNVANKVALSPADYTAITGINGTSFSVPTADGEPDLFFVKTPYFSFQFTFDENGEPVCSNETGIRITPINFYNSVNFSSSSFVVTDANGNNYYFGNNWGTVENTTTKLFNKDYTFPSTWYLTSISTFNSKDQVYFYYTSAPSNEITEHYQSSRGALNTGGCLQIKNESVTSTLNSPKFISSIATVHGEIRFSYLFDRRDIINAARLTKIELIASGSPSTLLQTYGFTYSYFGNPATDANLLRLKLEGITVAGNTTETSAPLNFKTFEYNTASNLPSRKDNSFDYWGYYTLFTAINGISDPLIVPQLRQPNEARTKANILTGIKEITGGSWMIDYEQNSYYKTSNKTNATVSVGGLRVGKISQILPSGENIHTTYQYNDLTGKSYGQVLTESYPNLTLSDGVAYQVFSETPSNIYDINGTFVGYSTVKTLHQNGGYIVSDFYNFSDFPDNFNYVNAIDPNTAPNITSSISSSYKRGLLKKQTIFSSSDNKISEDNFGYSSLTAPVLKKSWAFKWYPASISVSGSGCTHSVSTSFNSIYYTNIENYRLSTTIHTDYDELNTSNYIEKKSSFTYADNKRLVSSISTSSSKDPSNASCTQTFYYPGDSRNMPMITTNERLVMSSLVRGNNTDVLIHKTINNDGAISQLHNTYTDQDGKIYLTEATTYKESNQTNKQFFGYDASSSNLVFSYIQYGKPVTMLYGYKNTYPVAKITGADYNEVTSKINSFVLNNPSDEQALKTELGKLRSLPGAMVSTATYAPLIGKTSETDESGRTTFYDYDGFGRLYIVRDDDKNIIRQICYNYYGQPEECLRTYKNVARSQNFIRNNCESGYMGTSVSYTVTADKYSSTLSQSDADAKAQNEINASGQTYANIYGTCYTTCPFVFSTGLYAYTSNLTKSGNTINFDIVFPSPNTSYSGGTIGVINGTCRPATTRTIAVTDGGTSSRLWNMTVTSTGSVSIYLVSGAPATNQGTPIMLRGSFNP